MTEEFFLCQKSYGNTTRFNFFYTQFFFSLRVSGQFGHTNQKKNRYDQRPSKMILWKRWNFWWNKTLMDMQWFEVHFLAIFSSSCRSIKSWSKLAINQIASSFVVANNSECSKSLMGTVFLLRVKKSESQSCFYEAENRAAINLWVSANRYGKDLDLSKLLWV